MAKQNMTKNFRIHTFVSQVQSKGNTQKRQNFKKLCKRDDLYYFISSRITSFKKIYDWDKITSFTVANTANLSAELSINIIFP